MIRHFLSGIHLKGLLIFALSVGLVPEARADDWSKTDFELKVLEIIKKNPEAILESLSQYQQAKEKAIEEKRNQLAKAIAKDPAKFIGESPVFGSKTAHQFLFIFADFECPYCAQVRKATEELVIKHPNVALVYKNYPLTQIHSHAMSAAEAAWAAQQQGRFWQFHDILYSNQGSLGEDLYIRAASELGLDLKKFNSDRKSDSAKHAISADVSLADKLGISGTPFFLVNGQTFSGIVDISVLENKI